MEINEKIKELERQLTWCKHMIGTMFITVMVLVAIAAVPVPKSSLRLVSPNGLHSVAIKAGDNSSGIWITRGNGEPYVAMWNSEGLGTYVGVYGRHQGGRPSKNIDAALTVNDNGGVLQLSNRDEVKVYTPDSFVK
jgi:hypothetical protein